MKDKKELRRVTIYNDERIWDLHRCNLDEDDPLWFEAYPHGSKARVHVPKSSFSDLDDLDGMDLTASDRSGEILCSDSIDKELDERSGARRFKVDL